MKRTALLTAAAGTVLAAAGITLRQRRSAVADRDTAPAEQLDRWGELPCPPLREGVGHLHDWLSSGDWTDPADVLTALQEQAPAYLLADLVRDLATDLRAADHPGLAAQMHEAEQLLRQAAAVLGEVDYDEDGSPCPDEQEEKHPADCPGGCGGDGVVMETLTWEDQGDGIHIPVHQEPVDCPLGRYRLTHGQDCECGGTGYTYEPGYRHRCLGLRRLQPLPLSDEDPWASAPPYANADDYPG
ncbi:hypothetical protein P3T36_006362 [Kitasatospora sp. MAP12-15]|uniref:hypothetical protein n=1 Tax=unclassified Kitasatospora TaxID=2633591 RepID=UPI00247526A2|nr:hypothetical protein [Kitasatospora sp. MAP12-44]MDH6107903.1 hypothetical protein [Kitasatospora sp. MAP12-44]